MQRTQHSGLKIKEFRAILETGLTGDSVNVLVFLKDWLSNHILKTDKMYSAHLNAASIH